MTKNKREQVHVFVSGRVQGVAYRTYTQREANRLNISGWVKNLYDGRVEILAQGKGKDLTSFVDFLRVGSPSSLVESLDVTEEPADKAYSSFNIRFI